MPWVMPQATSSATSQCHVLLRHWHQYLAVVAVTGARSPHGLRDVILSLPFKHLGFPNDPPVLNRLMSQSARQFCLSRVLPALGLVLPLGVVNDQRDPIVLVRSLAPGPNEPEPATTSVESFPMFVAGGD